MTSPRLAVIICTYNRADSLKKALRSVLLQECDGFSYEIVVVDDASTDHTRETVQTMAADAAVPLRYVRQEDQCGIAHARNRGVTEARGDYVVFFDDDQLADPQWLQCLWDVAQEKNADIVGGPRRLDLPPDVLSRLGPVCRSILGENLYKGPPALLHGKELPTTGNLLIARRVFDAIGHFNAAISRSSGEDPDFILRAREHGFTIWTAPEAMVAHMIPAYRTTPAYFRWVSLRWGVIFARQNRISDGLFKTTVFALARIGRAKLLHIPRLVAAIVRGDAAAAADTRCLIWRAAGYGRTTLAMLAPRLFAQERFFEQLDFRNERILFGGADKENNEADGTRDIRQGSDAQ